MKASILHFFYSIYRKIMAKYGFFYCRFIRNSLFNQGILNEKIINFKKENKHVFFGYYDITPFSNDGKMLLAMHTPIINRSPREDDWSEIGFYYLNNSNNSFENKFISLGKTNVWCWQQGCRLQWYANKSDRIIYNCLVKKELKALIREVPSGKIVKEIKKPLYSVSHDGKWGLSLDFLRLQRLRPGYGYSFSANNSVKPTYNGIELIDLENNNSKQLFSLKKISEIEPHASMVNAKHYFNHLMFNPSGKKFLFYHLWNKSNKRYSRIFVADRDGSNLKLLNNSGKSSHYNWISEDEIILFSYINKYMYAIFNSLNGRVTYFGRNIPKKDGHPTYFKNKKKLITDTYPDLCSQRNLISYDIVKDKASILARFDSPDDFYGEIRCDLHPRISHDQKMICVDRIINGKRAVSVIYLDKRG